MKKCGNCGYEKNKDDKKFCMKCGKPLVHTLENEPTVLPFEPIEDEEIAAPAAEETAAEEKAVTAKIVCSNCGYEKNKEGRKFCIKCGKPLAYTEKKEVVILPFEPIPDEEELVSAPTEELSEKIIAEEPTAVPTEELPEETVTEEPATVPTKELSVKKRNPYLKYVIALIVVLLILGVIIIALIPDREEASELNNAEITTASETTYELTSAETTVTTEQPATVSETTSVTTVPTTATETTTTVPETTTTAKTTIESVTTTIETTTVPVTTTTVVTTVPKTEASTVKTTVTTTKKETSSAKRELLTPLDKVPEYTRYKMKNGQFYDEFDYEFIYDEDIIGEWNLVSVYDGDPSEFDFDKAVPFEEETHIWGKKLFFCSNSVVYCYRFPYKGIESLSRQWTLGLICEGIDETQPIVHEYEVWKIDGREYLLVKENSYATLNYDNGKAFSYLNYLIYEKVNSDEPSVKESNVLETITAKAPIINTDDGIERELLTPYDKVLAYERYKINNRGGISERIQPYFFISDETALGEWKSIDWISIEPSEYDPNVKYTTAYGHNLVFEDKGQFIWKWDKYTSEKSKWTLGLIIAPHGGGGNYVRSYQIWKIDGEEYLFCEEDDGFCNSTGTKSYHVFKKVE